MSLNARPSSFWSPPMPPRTSVRDAADAIKALVRDELNRGQEVYYARIAPACNGLPSIDLLGEYPCGAGADATGSLVLVTLKNGIPTVLTNNVAAPFASNAGATVATSVVLGEQSTLGKRFFVDQGGHVFEGRNYAYHHGSGYTTRANGAFIPAMGATYPTFSQLYQYGTNGIPEDPAYNQETILRMSGGVPVQSVTIAWFHGGSGGHVPAYDGHSAIMEFGGLQNQLHYNQVKPYLGLSSISGGGYRASSGCLVGVEGQITQSDDWGPIIIGVSVRRPFPGDMSLAAWTELPAVRDWIASGNTTGRFTPERAPFAIASGITAGGLYTGGARGRMFETKIDSNGVPDTFQWRSHDGGLTPPSAWSASIPITGLPQLLADGVTVTFASPTGHLLGSVRQIITERLSEAGIRALPVEDGTFVISITGSTRAWVVEADFSGTRVLEEVNFTGQTVTGWVAAVYI